MKEFEVRMTVMAESENEVDRWIDRMPHADRINECKIVDPSEKHFVARIRYVEDWNGKGEYYLFENRWEDESNECSNEGWGLDTAYKLIDDRLSYEALTKIRQLQAMGVPFYFA